MTNCICRKPDNGRWMIGCDFCDEWYHGACVSIDEKADGELIEKYACPRCVTAGLGRSSWKRKCRLTECRRPAQFNPAAGGARSKYCSREHGVEWARRLVRRLPKSHDGHTFDQALNAELTAGELATLRHTIDSLADFKRAGSTLPRADQAAGETQIGADGAFYMPEDLAALDDMAAAQARLQRLLAYNDLKGLYVDFAKDRALTRKAQCGFDRKLVWDDSEWQAWCDSADGQKMLGAIRALRAQQDQRVQELLQRDEAAGAEEPSAIRGAKRKGRKKNQSQVASEAVAELLAETMAEYMGEDDADVCALEKRRCVRHSTWQAIRTEEVELDDRVWHEQLSKLDERGETIRNRAYARAMWRREANAGEYIATA
ncbi:uncharacterized protein V1510DRAFT_416330 [Dipodascopsis tothii]|uniref:uncharacterized protein n=1 Tax=Dipodascopsis tothii TaxID=44089 RepID=UPI0034CEA6AA